MYKVKMDGQVLYYPGDKEAVLTNPTVNLQTGYAGTFEFTVPAINPLYDKIQNRRSMVSVFRDSTEIFYGEVRKRPKVDRYKNKSVYCAGAMSFLSDSIQPQAVYHDMAPRQMLGTFLDIHNSQVEDRKKIYLGIVTIKDANDSLYRFTNFENTLKAIREKLVEKLGGYLRLRHVNDKLYLDWITLEEYGKYCEQPIEFGLNLLDYSESVTAENLVTALIPLGARLQGESEIEGLEKYVDITSVNGGTNYIYSQEAVDTFGWVWATNTWQDVTEPSNLLRKGNTWLKDNQFEEMTLTLTAVDLSALDKEYDAFDCGDRIPCRARPYGMDRIFPVMEMTIPLQRPDSAKLTLGENRKLTYTEQQSRIYSGITATAEERRRIQNEAIKSAIDNLTAKMTGSEGGYKLTEFDENGMWLRDLYMDAPDKDQATNILQINKYGIGGSHNGYAGPYTVGMTLDGQVIGERVTANSIGAEKLTVEYKSELEGKFTQAGKDANAYTDQRETAVREVITTSIKSVEDQIQLAVTDQKSITNRYDYVKNGDNQKLSAAAFTATANMTVGTGQARNINALHLTKTDTSMATLQQSLGELPPGTYEVELKIYLPSGKKPSYCYFGLNGYTQYQTFSSMATDTWYTIKKTVTLSSKSTRSFYFALYGSSAREAYITDIRVLRNVKELIDDVDARITVEAGKITQSVTEMYEAQQHDYCVDGDFPDGFSGNYTENWYRNDTTYVFRTTWKEKTCMSINLGSATSTNYYLRTRYVIKVPRAGKFTVRFKACCGKTGTRLRCNFYSNKYTAAGDLGTEWQTIELTFDSVPAGNRYLYFYCNTTGDYICITDVEILGYAAHYNEAQLQITSDSITAEVTRAKNAEETLQSSIKVNADNIKLKVSKGNLSSEISAESGSISIKSNRISIASTNFTLTASGYVTMKGASCQGTFEAKNGSWFIKMAYGEITGGYGSTTYGWIDFAGAYNNSSARTLRLKGNTRVDIMGKLYTATTYNADTVWETFTGTQKIITNIKDIGNGAIQWTWTNFTFRNGMMMG
nr:MAG TPA: tail protein [Caudoviricetes sp.]